MILKEIYSIESLDRILIDWIQSIEFFDSELRDISIEKNLNNLNF